MQTPGDPVAVHPVSAIEAPNKRSSWRVLIPRVLLLWTTILLLMCLVSGRWMGTKTSGEWTETSIWGTCNCRNITAVTMCGEKDHKTDATKAFSIIAAASEYLAVIAMIWIPEGTACRIWIAFWLILAACSLVITVALFGDIFNDSMCGSKVKDNFHLDWAYGIRCGEFVFVTILAILALARARTRWILFFTILCLYLCVFTTTSRGWASRKHHVGGAEPTEEYGLWDYCTCERVGDFNCGKQKRLFRAAEAFEIISVAVAVFLMAQLLFLFRTARAPAAGLAWFLFICLCLPWIFIAAVWSKDYCGERFKDVPGYNLHWGFALQVAASGIMVICAVFIMCMPHNVV